MVRVSGTAAYADADEMSNRRAHDIYYTLVQAAMYILCFRALAVARTQGGTEFLRRCDWTRTLSSPLKPLRCVDAALLPTPSARARNTATTCGAHALFRLSSSPLPSHLPAARRHCVASVAFEFAEVLTALELVGVDEVEALLPKRAEEEGASAELGSMSVSSSAGAGSTSHSRHASNNPPPAKRSRRAAPSHAARYGVDEEEEEASAAAAAAKAADSAAVFPFDPYLLRRSSSFVTPIYQSWARPHRREGGGRGKERRGGASGSGRRGRGRRGGSRGGSLSSRGDDGDARSVSSAPSDGEEEGGRRYDRRGRRSARSGARGGSGGTSSTDDDSGVSASEDERSDSVFGGSGTSGSERGSASSARPIRGRHNDRDVRRKRALSIDILMQDMSVSSDAADSLAEHSRASPGGGSSVSSYNPNSPHLTWRRPGSGNDPGAGGEGGIGEIDGLALGDASFDAIVAAGVAGDAGLGRVGRRSVVGALGGVLSGKKDPRRKEMPVADLASLRARLAAAQQQSTAE